MTRSFLLAAAVFFRAPRLVKFGFQSIQAVLPELSKTAQPVLKFGKACRIELVDPALTLYPAADEAGLLEHLQVLGYSRRAYVESIGDLAGG